MRCTKIVGWAAAAAIGLAASTADATEIERVVSPGGIEAWLVHEPSIPIIAVEVMWRSGSPMVTSVCLLVCLSGPHPGQES